MCFSANFVTNDLEEEPAQFKEEKLKNQRRRSVTFNEEVEVQNMTNEKHLIIISKYLASINSP